MLIVQIINQIPVCIIVLVPHECVLLYPSMQSGLVESLEGEVSAVRSELSSVRQTHSREKGSLSERLEEMKKMATLTEVQTKSEKVRGLL